MSTQLRLLCTAWIATLSLVLGACSPISDVSAATGPTADDDVRSTDASAGAAQDAGIETRAPARIGRSCETAAVDTCSAEWPPTVATCRDGVWTLATVCRESERCQVMSGTARCMAVTDECLGHEPGVAFCDATAKMRVCIADGTSTELRCGKNERCQTLPDRVRCSCEGGAVPTAAGCEAATSCDVENGGCDTITTCDLSTGAPVCSACPDGYIGTGVPGCEPQLQALVPSCGTLEPAFAPGTHNYKLTVPTLCQSLQLTVRPPDKSTSAINGTAVTPDTAWQSALLGVGETPVKVAVTSSFGVISEYTVSVNRIGSQRAYIKASNAGAADVMGFALAADGDTIVSGAPWEDSVRRTVPDTSNAVETGAVYVYTPQNDSWVEQGFLKADPPVTLEYFGSSVAISGDVIVVGAPSTDPLGVTTLPANGYGSVYVFVRSNGVWTQQQKLRPKNGPTGDFFGIDVAISGDTILVGAAFDDEGGSHSGAVYEFRRGANGWEEKAKIKSKSPTQGSILGADIALNGDTFIAGAPLEANRAGAAYVFVRNGTGWEEQQRLQMPSPVENATFGWTVALLGDTAIIAAPRVDLVRETSPPGEVYVFERSASKWKNTQLMRATYSRDGDVFGSAVALSPLGLAIGANGDASGSRGANGDPSRSDASRSGAVTLYEKQGEKWALSAYLKADNADSGDLFGLRVAYGTDTLAITAGFEGSAASGVGADANSNDAYHSGALYIFK